MLSIVTAPPVLTSQMMTNGVSKNERWQPWDRA